MSLPPDDSDPALKRQRVLRSSAHPQSETRYDPDLIKQIINPDEALQSLKDNSDRELFQLIYGEVLQDVREIRSLLQEQMARPHFAKMAELQKRFDKLEAKLQGNPITESTYEPEHNQLATDQHSSPQ